MVRVQLDLYLSDKSGFSFWWMSLLVQKCNFDKSPLINDSIKLLALNHYLSSIRHIKKLECYSPKTSLINAVKSYAKKYNVNFSYKLDNILKNLYEDFFANSFLLFLKGLFFLLGYIIRRLPLVGVGLNGWRKSRAKVLFFSYLTGFSEKHLK